MQKQGNVNLADKRKEDEDVFRQVAILAKKIRTGKIPPPNQEINEVVKKVIEDFYPTFRVLEIKGDLVSLQKADQPLTTIICKTKDLLEIIVKIGINQLRAN